jgi:5'-3' exonuclease
MTTGLLDGDMYAFRCAISAEQEPLDIAILRLDLLVRESLAHVDSYFIAIGGSSEENFRYKINPSYKANRKDKPKPVHLDACKEFLLKEYNAIVCNGYEADDYLGFTQNDDSIIFTNDKDLLMIPGQHFNPIKKEYKEVSELDGLKHFYKQMLIGDISDNIKGIDKIGPVKAGKLIDHLETEEEMFRAVEDLYGGPIDNEYGMNRLNTNADCLWIWRKQGEKFSDRKLIASI